MKQVRSAAILIVQYCREDLVPDIKTLLTYTLGDQQYMPSSTRV